MFRLYVKTFWLANGIPITLAALYSYAAFYKKIFHGFHHILKHFACGWRSCSFALLTVIPPLLNLGNLLNGDLCL